MRERREGVTCLPRRVDELGYQSGGRVGVQVSAGLSGWGTSRKEDGQRGDEARGADESVSSPESSLQSTEMPLPMNDLSLSGL